MQYDKSLPEIEVHITKDGQEYTIPSGYSATIRWGKPDKHGCTATGTVSGSTVTFQVTEQMACVAGRSKVTVEIVESDSSQAGTAKFEVIVDSNPIGDNTIVSDSEIADIQKAIEAGQKAEEAITSATKAKESETNAKLSETNASNSAKEAKASADSVANVVSDVSQLKEDLAALTNKSKNMFFVEQGEIINGIITVNVEKTGSVINFRQNGQNTSNVYAVIKRLELEAGKTYTFSATRKSGYYNDSGAIILAIYRTDNNAIVGSFSFWEILNGSSNSFTFTPDYSSYYIQVTFASTGTIKEYDCDINFNLVEGAIADYSEYGYVNINKELPTIKYLLKHNIYDIVVAKDGSGDYTNLTEAVENANDFSIIYVKNGVYDNEIIKAWLKTVFIVGESREGVIVKNNTGAYATPPIEMGTGMLKNLTVYAEGNATPNNKGYALHSESSVEASSCNFFILENCTFKSDYRQSWGMGMRGDTHYYARNCTFEEVYFHDCEHAYRATNQYIEFDSCNIIAKANGTALLLQDQQMNSANVNLMFNRCLVKSENGANIQYGKWTGSGIEWVSSLDDFPTWHLSTYSFGNSDNALNA